MQASLAVINVTRNKEVEIFSGSRPSDLEFYPGSNEAEHEEPNESAEFSQIPGVLQERIGQTDLFSTEEVDNFSDLLPSSMTMQAQQTSPPNEANPRQTPLSRVNEFFNEQINFN